MELRTARLHLIEADIDMIEAELHDRARFSALIRAELPRKWPPPLNDEASALWIITYLRRHPNPRGWSMWFFILEDDGKRTAIGNGGFKGEPADGAVEVGYSIVEEFHRRGFATEAVGALIEWAFGHAGVERVIAETLPELIASQGVLRKLGFTPTAGASGPDILRFEKVPQRGAS